MSCPYCPMSDPEQKIIFENALVLFMQHERDQGALKHAGVIMPVQHKETVFDFSEAEITATFRLLSVVKKWMYYNDHSPPHFHAVYAEHEALFAIDTFEILDGELPRRPWAFVVEWASLHREELRGNWERARQGLPLQPIEPLD